MNKLLFLTLTTLCLIILIVASSVVESNYIVSDYYIPNDMFQSEDGVEVDSAAMPLKEYLEYVDKGIDPEFEDFTEYPLEFQLVEAKSALLRIFSFIIILTLSIFAGFLIKDNRIDFSVLALDSNEKGINMARIAMYVSIIMTVFITSQSYPFNYIVGWIPTVLWIISLLAIMVWILNIIYAFKERKALKGKTIKPARL